MATILIVEDDASVARQMVSLARGAGHTPVLAPGARAALRAAEFRPDVIVLDFGVRDVQGEDVIERLVRMPEAACAPVVIITGNTERATRLLASKPPWLADIVMKPVDSRRWFQAVQTALAINGNAVGAGRR